MQALKTKQIEQCSNYIEGLVQERRNSIAHALALRLLCTYLSIYALAMSLLS